MLGKKMNFFSVRKQNHTSKIDILKYNTFLCIIGIMERKSTIFLSKLKCFYLKFIQYFIHIEML